MNLKTVFTVALLAIVPNCGKKAPSAKKAVSAVTKEVLKPDTLKANIKKVAEIDTFKMLHRQTRKDTLVGNAVADTLAKKAGRYTANPHKCYRNNKKPIREVVGINLNGGSAYMAADSIKHARDSATGWPYFIELTDPQNPVFKDNEVILNIKGLNQVYIDNPRNNEVKEELRKVLKKELPGGVIEVWDRLKPGNGKNWVNNGHIGITNGKGQEKSWNKGWVNQYVFPTKLKLYISNHPANEEYPSSAKIIAEAVSEKEYARESTRAFLTNKSHMKRLTR